MADNRVFEGIWIPAELWFSRDLSITEKAIFLEVKTFDNEFGCVATNKKIGSVLDLQAGTVSGILKVLEAKGYIKITYKDLLTHSGRVINVLKYSNKATPRQKSYGGIQKSQPPQQESIHSNIISNITSIDSKLSNAELPSSTTANIVSDAERCRKFIDKFNSIKLNKNGNKSKYRSDNDVCAKLKQRLKKYTPEEILLALKNALKDEFHIKTEFMYVTPEYIVRSKTLEKYLNIDSNDGSEKGNDWVC